MQLVSNGIHGTPTTEGTYRCTLRFDSEKGYGISFVTVRVGGVKPETRALPIATTGQMYAAQLKGSVLAAGDSLPPGLTLIADGTLSGTPTSPWLYKFSVVQADPAGDSVTSTYTLEVINP
jgi:hypothetical protein